MKPERSGLKKRYGKLRELTTKNEDIGSIINVKAMRSVSIDRAKKLQRKNFAFHENSLERSSGFVRKRNI